jgi:hypothetical protein
MRFNPTDVAYQGELTEGFLEWQGHRSRARDGSQLSPTFGDVNDELQQSASDKIRLLGGGATHRRVTWCWLGAARSPMEQR